MIGWLKYSKVYFSISVTVLLIGVFSLVKWGLPLGVDFKGGTVGEYQFQDEISTEEITNNLQENGITVNSIQSVGDRKYLFKLSHVDAEGKEKIKNVLQDTVGNGLFEELRFESVGPTIGPELTRKTLYAIAIAAFSILLWIAYQFKSFKFGVSAILAMFHDTFLLVGIFSLLGHVFQVEADFLFVTALLTTLSFSVHDTIVLYDRIRETQKKYGGEFYDVANRSISETMVRSLNNSFTIVFMLVALILLGGTTVKWFAVALLIGTVSGTYSSPFVAVPLLNLSHFAKTSSISSGMKAKKFRFGGIPLPTKRREKTPSA